MFRNLPPNVTAVVLAGGKGTRLRPFTTTIPKPLVPVGDQPILSIILDQLQRAGVERVILAVSHMAELIISFFGDGTQRRLRLEYSVESEPLGTVGPLRQLAGLPEHFLVMNGDVLTDLDYRELLDAHKSSGAGLTIATYSRQVESDFGVLRVDSANSSVTGFEEKPVLDFDVSMGVYAFSRSVLDHVPEGRPYGFDELVLSMLKRGNKIQAFRHRGYWLDLGRPDDYDQANKDVEAVLARSTARKVAS